VLPTLPTDKFVARFWMNSTRQFCDQPQAQTECFVSDILQATHLAT